LQRAGVLQLPHEPARCSRAASYAAETETEPAVIKHNRLRRELLRRGHGPRNGRCKARLLTICTAHKPASRHTSRTPSCYQRQDSCSGGVVLLGGGAILSTGCQRRTLGMGSYSIIVKRWGVSGWGCSGCCTGRIDSQCGWSALGSDLARDCVARGAAGGAPRQELQSLDVCCSMRHQQHNRMGAVACSLHAHLIRNRMRTMRAAALPLACVAA
jgi:hypothetical protein